MTQRNNNREMDALSQSIMMQSQMDMMDKQRKMQMEQLLLDLQSRIYSDLVKGSEALDEDTLQSLFDTSRAATMVFAVRTGIIKKNEP